MNSAGDGEGRCGEAISLSGYHVAGIEPPATTSTRRHRIRNPALIHAASTMSMIPGIPRPVLERLFRPSAAAETLQPHGTRFTALFTASASVLDLSGVPAAVLTVPQAHSWSVVRTLMSTMLQPTAVGRERLGIGDRRQLA